MLKCLWKLMSGGGELTVGAADLCEAGGSTLLVEISDIGLGIPDDVLHKIKISDLFVTTKSRGSALNYIGPPGSTPAIEFPVPDRRSSPLHT